MLLKQSCFDTSPALLLSGCLLQRMADLVEFQNLFLARVWVGWLFFFPLKKKQARFPPENGRCQKTEMDPQNCEL